MTTKCPRCKCLCNPDDVEPGAHGAPSCSRCRARSSSPDRWAQIKADPVRLAAWNAAKRDLRKRQQQQKEQAEADRLKRFREVMLRPGTTVEPDLTDRDQFVNHCRALYEGGQSTTSVAKSVGKTPGYVYKVLKDAGVAFRSRTEATRTAMLGWHAVRAMQGTGKSLSGPTSEEVAAIYASGVSLSATARLAGISVDRVRVRLARSGVTVRSSAEQWALSFNPDGTPRNPLVEQK